MTMMMSRRRALVGWSTTTLKKALENTLLVVVVTRGGVGADAGALLTLGAARLQCPPGVFRAVMADVRDAVDAALFAAARSDSEHAARLDDDAREVVLDSSFY